MEMPVMVLVAKVLPAVPLVVTQEMLARLQPTGVGRVSAKLNVLAGRLPNVMVFGFVALGSVSNVKGPKSLVNGNTTPVAGVGFVTLVMVMLPVGKVTAGIGRAIAPLGPSD